MKIELTLKQMQDAYDWEEVFKYAHPERCEGSGCEKGAFTLADVDEVLASVEGENDGPSWDAIFLLKDGRYAYITAGCDYTGWGCMEGGSSWVSDDLENLIQFGLGAEARMRLEVYIKDQEVRELAQSVISELMNNLVLDDTRYLTHGEGLKVLKKAVSLMENQ